MQKNNVKSERKKIGISQTRLGFMTEIAPNVISNIENGKIFVYPGWRKRIAKALGVPEDVLFPDEEAERM